MAEQKAASVAPITEVSENHRKIPKVVFIDNTEAWVEKYGDDDLFAQLNELYQKYKFMETQLARARQNLKVKLPDIKKTLEMVAMLKTRSADENKQVETPKNESSANEVEDDLPF